MKDKSNLNAIYWLLVAIGMMPSIWISSNLIDRERYSATLLFKDPTMALVFLFLFLSLMFVAYLLGGVWRITLGIPLLFLSTFPAYNNLVLGEPVNRLAIPSKAVLAFDLDVCPQGWIPVTELAGRVIVGSGNGDGLTVRNLGDRGGSETHQLTEPEMPAHSHGYTFSSGKNSPHSVDETTEEFGMKDIPDQRTSTTGGNQPHNTMQPFHVMLYCMRE